MVPKHRINYCTLGTIANIFLLVKPNIIKIDRKFNIFLRNLKMMLILSKYDGNSLTELIQ